GADGPHAAIGLEGAALVQIDLTRAFIRAGQERADHDGRRPGGDRLGEIAGELDAAIGDDRNILVARSVDGGHDGGKLRHTDAGDDACRADRAGTDTDLDRI